ncbi:UDP-forming cellulose synthase catalytic subunit [Methylosinus sp. KRF6]|uniref:UDP-forming cellulose synthase catalytic subunit n=1 Tax=Methylosinus sp. KRF6 TaxID=2846853 RepID=UPI001C0CEAE1|nr:UDP-forming cellulose synthase catalytic subunit [Methylosinus sp. KRF6]MBU3888296.1 UDP-forming cellulose synthase catalytic subunit [Methylosinus sp. KRF6]
MSLLRFLSFLLLGAVAVALATQPVSVQAQLATSLSVIMLLAFVWKFARGAEARQLFIALALFVVLRYVYWRVTSTLPPLSDPVGFTCGSILLAAELYCVAMLLLTLVVNAEPLKREPAPQIEDEALPAVDVLVPSYDESASILATTLAAAKSMDYPADRLNVFLLDDGGTEQKCAHPDPEIAERARARRASLQELCAALGCYYLTREHNERAKAGNLNAALEHIDGDIVVVLDADHAPFRSFLRETIGYFFEDDRLFLVQTPHVFLNPDPIEQNLRTFRHMPSENEMFYGVTQRGLDKWNAAFFCGSAALLRRAALDEAGGFSGVSVTEDCETALELHAQGWTSVYVDKPLVAGLQPQTFAAFIGQRVRWCQGMLQILLLRNPLLKRGLEPLQRLGYLSSMSFWFFPFPRLVFMLAPLAFILFDVKIFVSNIEEAIAYTATYVVVNAMLQNYLFGRVRWPWVSELYEYCQGVFLSKAILSVLLRPHSPSFCVTEKGATRAQDRLSELAWPFFAIYGLLAIGAVVAVYRCVAEPGVRQLIVFVGLWNFFNLVTAGVALGAVAERRRREKHPSLPVERRGALALGEEHVRVAIEEVSAGGCRLRAATEADAEALAAAKQTEGRFFIDSVVDAARRPSLSARIVGVAADGHRHIVFALTQPQDHLALADLMYGDATALERFQAARRKHKGIVAGTAQFLWWGAIEPLRAFGYLRPRAGEAARSEPPPIAELPSIFGRRQPRLRPPSKVKTPPAIERERSVRNESA